MAFYKCFSGYRIVYTPDVNITLGVKTPKQIMNILIDKKARIINEAGSNYCFNSFIIMLSPLASTSKMTDTQIYKSLREKTRNLRFHLVRSYLKGNPYDLDITRVSDITTTIEGAIFIASKSKDGFTLTKLNESIMTANIIRNGGVPPDKKEGIIEQIQHGFSGNR